MCSAAPPPMPPGAPNYGSRRQQTKVDGEKTTEQAAPKREPVDWKLWAIRAGLLFMVIQFVRVFWFGQP